MILNIHEEAISKTTEGAIVYTNFIVSYLHEKKIIHILLRRNIIANRSFQYKIDNLVNTKFH